MARDISLTGGGPWGFTLSGGKDFGAPLKISKITPGGKAAKGGIRFGDYILEINGDTTEGLLHSDAMMVIKTTGVTLNLKVSKEMPRWGADAADGAPADTSLERPRPPPVPTNTTPAIPVKTTVVQPKKPPSPEVKSQPSSIAPDSGLDSGGSSTQQSPAFKRIHIDKGSLGNRPPVFNRAAANAPAPTEQMKNIVIDDGNVKKTSERPQPPPSSPSTVTKSVVKVPKSSPITKPPPPASTGRTTQVGGQQSGGGSAKISDRQGVCEACGEPIRGPFASAMGKVWHPEHFKCTSCQRALQNTTFVLEDDHIYCENCYQKNFAQTCNTCHEPIVGPCISAVGLHWHQEHFVCSRCQVNLASGAGFQMENNQLFCTNCYGTMYGATCFGCSQKIGDELWVEALEHQWHPACFVCDSCRRPLQGATFFARLGRPCCKDCV